MSDPGGEAPERAELLRRAAQRPPEVVGQAHHLKSDRQAELQRLPLVARAVQGGHEQLVRHTGRRDRVAQKLDAASVGQKAFGRDRPRAEAHCQAPVQVHTGRSLAAHQRDLVLRADAAPQQPLVGLQRVDEADAEQRLTGVRASRAARRGPGRRRRAAPGPRTGPAPAPDP